MYFDTDPKWMTDLRAWAHEQTDIERLWVFGSRATGRRRPKDHPSEIPDLDLAFEMPGEDDGERLGAAMFAQDTYRAAAQVLVPVSVDLQFSDPARQDRVPSWVRAHGQLIYDRTAESPPPPEE